MMKDLKKLVYTDGTTLEDHVSSDLYDQCVAIMKENNSYNKALDSYSVVMWSQLVDSCTATKLENDGSEGIDVYLLNMAHEDGKEIQDIESSTMQYQMLMSFSEPLQELMLEASVNNYYDPDGYLRSVDDMMDIWQEGDPDDLEKLISGTGEFDGEDEEELFEEYFDTMFRQRNVGMADFAEDALESGDEVFICVGAGHIIGEEGVAELLRDRGYTVEVVY